MSNEVNLSAGPEYLRWTALEQARAIAAGELSSVELCGAYLQRIRRHNPQLQAFVSVFERQALRTAEKADQQRIRGGGLPVFHGVPTGVKDLVPLRMSRTMLGSRAYRYLVTPKDAPTGALIRRGGFVILGKLATSEFGVLPITEPDVHPPTRNPWDTGRSAGGSSGGSGAAVAGNLVPIAHGSDGGGSIRIPSSLCGTYGFKPSLSLLGNLHGKFNGLGLSVMGPLSRSVEDAAAMLDVLAGRPESDAGEGTCLAAARSGSPKLKVRLITESALGDVSPEVLDATLQAADQLRTAGHTVEHFDPSSAPPAGSIEEFLPVWRYAVSGVPSISERLLRPVTRWLRNPKELPSFEEAHAARLLLASRIEEHFDHCDVLLTPTVAHTAPKIGEHERPDDPAQWFRDTARYGALTAPFNLTQGPAASLPLGLTAQGLPYGVQIAGPAGGDHRVLALSRELEQAMPWRDRQAPDFAV